MKKIAYRLVPLLFSAALSASALDAPPDFLWARKAGGHTNSDIAYAVAASAAGDVYVTGSFAATNDFGSTNLVSSGFTDIFVAKYNSAGGLLWARRAGGTGYDEGRGLAVDGAGNAYVTGIIQGTASFGTTNLTSTGQSDVFITKYDSAGNVVWARRAGGNDFDEAHAVALDAAGNLYVTGTFDANATFGSFSLQNNSQSSDIFVAKTDPQGTFLWVRKAGGNAEDDGKAIAVDSATNVYVTGFFAETATFGTSNLTSRGSSGLNDVFLAKYSSAGNLVWVQQAGGTNHDHGLGVTTDNAGNVILTGDFTTTGTFGTTDLIGNGRDAFVVKFDSVGSLIWARKAGGNDSIYGDSGKAVMADGAGNVYVTGYFSGNASFGPTNLTTSGFDDVFVAKYDAVGNLLWARKAGGSGIDVAFGIALDAATNVYAAGFFYILATFGSTELTSAGLDDSFVVMLSPLIPTPYLSLQISGNDLVLSWPASATGFILESNSELPAATNWTTVPTITNGITLPASESKQFFRLRKP